MHESLPRRISRWLPPYVIGGSALSFGVSSVALVMVLLLFRAGTVLGQETPGIFGHLDGLEAFVQEQMADWFVPGLALGVVSIDGNGDAATYLRGFGYRDLARELPVTSQTVFSVGSCAKAFTAAAMATLVADGALGWDTPIQKVVPSFRLYDDYTTLHTTPRDLLAQRTGIAGYDMLQHTPTTGREALWERIAGLEPSAGFRERFQYANLSYLMAGRVVEQVAGVPFEAFVRSRLLEPMGMTSTTLSYAEARNFEEMAVPYRNFGIGARFGDGSFPSPDFDILDPAREALRSPSGGVYSSLEDMMKWVGMHLLGGMAGRERVLPEATIRAMHSVQAPISYDPNGSEQTYRSYGMGWFVQDYRGHPTVQHAGQVFGYMTQITLLPRDGIGVVVLTNAYYHHAHYIIAKTVLDRLLGLEPMDRSGELEGFKPVAENLDRQTREFWETRPEDGGSPSRPLNAYAGSYSNPLYGSISVNEAEEGLEVTIREEVVLALRHYSHATFAADTPLLDFFHTFFDFRLAPDGTVEGVRIPWDQWEGGVFFSREEG